MLKQVSTSIVIGLLLACSSFLGCSDDAGTPGGGGSSSAGASGSTTTAGSGGSGQQAGSGGGSSTSGSGGSATSHCTKAEVAVIQACVPIYTQQSYPTCSAIAACVKNDVRKDISDACYICAADVAATCTTTNNELDCACCEK
jgi:hypothetical protein